MLNINGYGSESGGIEPLEPTPDLCHKCGRCCRSATTVHSHARLLEMVAEGKQDAIDFLSVFKPFPSIEEARKVEPEQVAQVLKEVSERSDLKLEELTFYYCEHVSPEGLCTIYERRPRCCREAPGNGWSIMPPGCGFKGWQFEQREKQKRMVRDLKNSVYIMEQLSPDGVHHPTRPEMTLEELRETVKEKLKPWKTFGAEYW